MTETAPISFSKTLIDTLRAAQTITVLTGAGISAESGIPTFRDSQTGLWAQYDPHELATPEAFADNPERVLDWYRWRYSLVAQSKPNAGHYALVNLEQRVPHFTLITQNVDGLHRVAGSRNVIELHGNIDHLRCTKEGSLVAGWPQEKLPHCPNCGSLLRPNVVWFGESLPAEALQKAVAASTHCDVFLSVGTSGMVEPAASLAYEALRAGVVVVEINPSPTPLTVYTSYQFPATAGQVLPALLQAVWPA
jgi:NAD-dependent deacetylase